MSAKQFDWYKITTLTEFMAADLPSRDYEIQFPTSIETVSVYVGDYVSVMFRDVFVPIGLNGDNPCNFDGIGVFYDEDDYIWIGIEVES